MEFTSALPYAKVRDFAYHDRHPLHYGVRDSNSVVASPRVGDNSSFDTDLGQSSLLKSDTAQETADQVYQPSSRNSSQRDIYRRAVSLFDFEPENENETRLEKGHILWISYSHGQGWLVAENLETGQTGLVPEEYVQVLPENDEEWIDT